jgi:hypothetical protein
MDSDEKASEQKDVAKDPEKFLEEMMGKWTSLNNFDESFVSQMYDDSSSMLTG